jgi:DNA-binding beta-propeller fold protein YncE
MERCKYILIVIFILCLTSITMAQQIGGYAFVPLDGIPHDVIHDAGRNVAYVSDRMLHKIDVISLANNSVISSIPVGNTPMGMALTPDNNELLVILNGERKLGIVDLTTGVQTRTIDLPTGLSYNSPLRVGFDAAGTCFWRDGSGGNPYGYAYTIDLQTEISTRRLQSEPITRYTFNQNRSSAIFTFSGGSASVWDANTQSFSPRKQLSGFGSGYWEWPIGETINNDGSRILVNKSNVETRLLDSNLTSLGFFDVSMGWGTFGPWHDFAVIAEGNGSQPLNRITLLNTESITILDTLELPELIGYRVADDYDYSTKPIDITVDGGSLLAVGQTGLFIIDTTQIPEPATLSLLLLGGMGLVRRRRR